MKRLNVEADRILMLMIRQGDGALEHDALSEYLASYMRAIKQDHLTDSERTIANNRFWKVLSQLRRRQKGARGQGRPRQPFKKTFRAELKEAIIVCLTARPDAQPGQSEVATAMAHAQGMDTSADSFDEYSEARQLRRRLEKHCIGWDEVLERAWLEWFFDMQNSVRD